MRVPRFASIRNTTQPGPRDVVCLEISSECQTKGGVISPASDLSCLWTLACRSHVEVWRPGSLPRMLRFVVSGLVDRTGAWHQACPAEARRASCRST
eukprot:1120397-Rhodomonas_salina.2